MFGTPVGLYFIDLLARKHLSWSGLTLNWNLGFRKWQMLRHRVLWHLFVCRTRAKPISPNFDKDVSRCSGMVFLLCLGFHPIASCINQSQYWRRTRWKSLAEDVKTYFLIAAVTISQIRIAIAKLENMFEKVPAKLTPDIGNERSADLGKKRYFVAWPLYQSAEKMLGVSS
jgi:hypothetical protein